MTRLSRRLLEVLPRRWDPVTAGLWVVALVAAVGGVLAAAVLIVAVAAELWL